MAAVNCVPMTLYLFIYLLLFFFFVYLYHLSESVDKTAWWSRPSSLNRITIKIESEHSESVLCLIRPPPLSMLAASATWKLISGRHIIDNLNCLKCAQRSEI